MSREFLKTQQLSTPKVFCALVVLCTLFSVMPGTARAESLERFVPGSAPNPELRRPVHFEQFDFRGTTYDYLTGKIVSVSPACAEGVSTATPCTLLVETFVHDTQTQFKITFNRNWGCKGKFDYFSNPPSSLWVKALGRSAPEGVFDVCSSSDYFILYALGETPLGPATEHFFDNLPINKRPFENASGLFLQIYISLFVIACIALCWKICSVFLRLFRNFFGYVRNRNRGDTLN